MKERSCKRCKFMNPSVPIYKDKKVVDIYKPTCQKGKNITGTEYHKGCELFVDKNETAFFRYLRKINEKQESK